MHYYRERHMDEAILKDAPVKFDRYLDGSLNSDLEPDFEYDEIGYIIFKSPGYYLVKWSTTSQTGFFQDGPWFDLRYYNQLEEKWMEIGNGEDRDDFSLLSVKNSGTGGGFIPFEVLESDLESSGGSYRIALFNISGNSVQMSRFPTVKASFVVYGVPYFDVVINDLLSLLDEYEAECCGLDLESLIQDLERMEENQNRRLTTLKNFKDCFQSQLDWYFIPEPDGSNFTGTYPPVNFNGLGVSVIRVGYTYTFQMSGIFTTTNNNAPGNANKRYFLSAENNALFDYFNLGAAMLVPLIFAEQGASGKGLGIAAAWVDNTGIYLLGTPPGSNGYAYSFCFSLIFKELNNQVLCSLDGCTS